MGLQDVLRLPSRASSNTTFLKIMVEVKALGMPYAKNCGNCGWG